MPVTGQLVRKDNPDIQIDAVFDVIPAHAMIAHASIACGAIDLVYFGETKIDWDGQRTVQGPQGRLFVDQNGALVPETEVVLQGADGALLSPKLPLLGAAAPAGSMMQALHRAASGSRVRRGAWAPTTYLHFEAAGGFVVSDLTQPGSSKAYSPGPGDAGAGDWQVLGEDGPPDSPGDPPSGSGVAEAPARAVQARGTTRLAKRAMAHGLETLDAGEALELYISRTRPKGAATLAALLIARFADVQHVLGATIEELAQVVDRELALELKLLHDMAARLLIFPVVRRPVISSWSALLAYLRLQMGGSSVELVRALFLDKKNQLIADEVVGRGSIAHAPVYPREIVRRALDLGASAVILSHPHPSGDPTPSREDIEITRQVIAAGKPLGVAVYDHVIVGGDQTVSLKALGLI